MKRLFCVTACLTAMFVDNMAGAQTTSEVVLPVNCKKIILCEQKHEGGLTIIGKPVEDPQQIGVLEKSLKENAVQVELEAADMGGYLCYVVFEMPKQSECIIARIQITSGLILMLGGNIRGEEIEVNWGRDFGLWKSDKFVTGILAILKEKNPEYLAELDSFYTKITGKSVEERLKKPLKSNK